MDNKERLIDTLKEDFGFREGVGEEVGFLVKKISGKDFILFIAIEEGETLYAGLKSRSEHEEGIQIYEGKVTLDKVSKLIDRYRKICKI